MKHNNDSMDLPKELLKYNKYTNSYGYNDGYPYTNITAYFKNGVIYKVRPFKFIPLYSDLTRANRAQFIVSDGKKYDLLCEKSIQSIPVPNCKTPSGMMTSPTFYLEYILKMHPETNNIEIDTAIMDKVIEIMDYSFFSYSIDTYLQLPRMLYRKGVFELGDDRLNRILTTSKFVNDYDGIKMKHYRDYYFKKYTNPDSVPKSFSAYMRKINRENK